MNCFSTVLDHQILNSNISLKSFGIFEFRAKKSIFELFSRLFVCKYRVIFKKRRRLIFGAKTFVLVATREHTHVRFVVFMSTGNVELE